MEPFKIDGHVVALSDDTGEGEPLQKLSVTFDGVGQRKHSSRTRLADTDDKRALRLSGKIVMLNQRQVAVITSDMRRAIEKKMGVDIAAEILRINIEVDLDDPTLEFPAGVPGIAHIPPGSILRFKSGVILQAQVPMYPCGDTGQRIVDRNADKKELKSADFNDASHIPRPIPNIEEWYLYSQRGLAFNILTLSGDESIHERVITLGEEVSLETPPDYRIRTKKKPK